MGLDTHALLFVQRVVSLHGPLGKTATIGRQEIHVPWQVFQKLTGHDQKYDLGTYCEELLINCFGSSEVDSFDNSSYEGANQIHDFNAPIPKELHGKYDTIIDAGSMEHIYDVKTAIGNFSKMLKPGGQVLHIVPANNQCGHGFYQFSPELFFSTYSPERGFDGCEVLLARPSRVSTWYRVRRPISGQRAEVYSGLPLVNLVRAQLREDGVNLSAAVQQSDYIHWWGQSSSGETSPDGQAPSIVKRLIMRNAALFNASMRLYFWIGQSSLVKMYVYRFRKGLSAKNEWLTAERSTPSK